jgi:hypothetical protein
MDRIERFFEEPVFVLEPQPGSDALGFTEPASVGVDQVMVFDVGRDLCRWLLDSTTGGLILDRDTPVELQLTREQLTALVELDRDESSALVAATLVVPRNAGTGAPFATATRFVVTFRDRDAYAAWQSPAPSSPSEMRARDFFTNVVDSDLAGVIIDADTPNERWIRREGLRSILRYG